MFDGDTYSPEQDGVRLRSQLRHVLNLLHSHPNQWFTLHELSKRLKAPEASISARLRDLRKPKFGGHHIEAKRITHGRGTWHYRLVRIRIKRPANAQR